VAADLAQQERAFPWQRRPDERHRAGPSRAHRENHSLDRMSMRGEPERDDVTSPAELSAGLPGLPQLLREAAQAITGAEARVLAAEEQMRDAIAAAEERVRSAEARAKAAEELAHSLEKRATEAIRAAERRADAAELKANEAEAGARAAEEWVTRVRRVLNDGP
jgi:hypothetical protein